jgi:hypothetical protein
MLGNSGFLAGGLPVEYGYATGGTFDLRLRPGSKTRRKYQAQAGFIGFDLMAEGPIGSSGKTSYLVNGRYSFTGLLADMGVDFGGEEIRFWDFNGHLHHEWDGGEISAFAILGQSSNVFRGPDSTEQEITEQKELFDIDFESNLEVYGFTYARNPKGRNNFHLGLSYSSNQNERNQQITDNRFLSAQYDLGVSQLNAHVRWEKKIKDFGQVKFGTEYLRQAIGSEPIFQPSASNNQSSLAPFAQYTYDNQKWQLFAGLRYSIYNYGVAGERKVIEPRVQVGYRWKRSSLLLVAETRSQTLLATEYVFFTPPGRQYKSAIINHQLSLKHTARIGQVTLGSSAFFQLTPDDYSYDVGGFLNSRNNIFELVRTLDPVMVTATRRFGIEAEFGGGNKKDGWYYRGSLTLFKAETQQLDESWTKDRYSSDYIGKLTLGREWPRVDKNNREVTLGINLALITHGGERYGESQSAPWGPNLENYFAAQGLSQGFLNSTGSYFRPDLRLYKTKTRKKTTTTLALDVQNAANVQNLANVYYDAFLEQPTERYQLGFIPVLSYRIAWR